MRPNSLQRINPTHFPEWNHMVSSFENASCFHTSNWARTICESYGYDPSYFILNDDVGLSAVIPLVSIKSLITGRRAVSLPFTDFCHPLMSGNCNFQDILSNVIDHCKHLKWNHIELRGCHKYLPEQVPSEMFYTHRLLLDPDIQKMYSSFRSSTCRNIKKAQKQGVHVQIQSTMAFVQTFFELNCLTRRQHGLPPQPLLFFKNLYEHLIAKGLGKTAIAFYQSEPVAGAIFLNFGKKVIYKYGASDSRLNHLRANNLVMWEAIKWYAQNDYKELHMGRTKPSHSGLDQFKSGWKTIKETLFYYKYDLIQKSFVKKNESQGLPYEKIFSVLPLPFLRMVGKIAYRHIG